MVAVVLFPVFHHGFRSSVTNLSAQPSCFLPMQFHDALDSLVFSAVATFSDECLDLNNDEGRSDV